MCTSICNFCRLLPRPWESKNLNICFCIRNCIRISTSIVPVSREKGVNGEVSASTSADERMHLMWRMGTYALTLHGKCGSWEAGGFQMSLNQ